MQHITPEPSKNDQNNQPWEAKSADSLKHWHEILVGAKLPPASFGDIVRNTAEDYQPEQWVRLIAHDPVLSAKLLAVVNCAAMGLTKPMTDLQRAVTHLGSNITRIIVIGYYIEGLLGKWDYYPRQHFDFVRNWCASAAILANHFARAAKLEDPGTLSTAALLSRLGSFILALEWPGPRTEYVLQPSERARLEYELATWRITSPVLGCLTAEHWGLPEPIPRLIERHLHATYTSLEASAANREIILLGAAVVIAADYVKDSELSLDRVLYADKNELLLNNINAHGLLDAVSSCWDRKSLHSELAALAD